MKLCESFFPFRLECVRVTASCVPPDRLSEDFALRHRVHSLTLSSILRQFLHICVKPRPPSLRDISVKILFPPFCLVAEQKVMQCGMHKQTTLRKPKSTETLWEVLTDAKPATRQLA